MKRLFLVCAALGAVGCRGPVSGAEVASRKAELLRVDDRAVAAVSPVAGARPKFAKTSLTLPDGAVFGVELAATPTEREYGLMFRESLPSNYGMLFVFPERRFLTFWMKNTLVDLDMIFLDEARRITVVYSRVPKSSRTAADSDLARRSGVGRYVLELPGGTAERHGLAPGQTLSFEVP